jgi:hypothetical protein
MSRAGVLLLSSYPFRKKLHLHYHKNHHHHQQQQQQQCHHHHHDNHRQGVVVHAVAPKPTPASLLHAIVSSDEGGDPHTIVSSDEGGSLLHATVNSDGGGDFLSDCGGSAGDSGAVVSSIT